MRTQSSKAPIGPDRLKPANWYETAFQQLGVPPDKTHLLHLPQKDPIQLLVGQNADPLLCNTVNPQSFEFHQSFI